MNGVFMKYELKGTKEASYKVDQPGGWIRTANIKEVISGTVGMQASAKVPDVISWPISIEWTVECRGTRLR